jgi:hypothetical protein
MEYNYHEDLIKRFNSKKITSRPKPYNEILRYTRYKIYEFNSKITNLIICQNMTLYILVVFLFILNFAANLITSNYIILIINIISFAIIVFPTILLLIFGFLYADSLMDNFLLKDFKGDFTYKMSKHEIKIYNLWCMYYCDLESPDEHYLDFVIYDNKYIYALWNKNDIVNIIEVVNIPA